MEDMKSMKKKSYIYSLAAALLMVLAFPFALAAQTDAAKHETVKVYFRQGILAVHQLVLKPLPSASPATQVNTKQAVRPSKGYPQSHFLSP